MGRGYRKQRITRCFEIDCCFSGPCNRSPWQDRDTVCGVDMEARDRLTLAGHIDQHIHVDIHVTSRVPVHAKLIIWPSPDILPEVIEHKNESQKGHKDGQEATRL